MNKNGYNLYTTDSLNVYPQYNYTNGLSQIIGQQASQTLTATIMGFDSKGTKIGILVDALSLVPNISINSITFDINDKSSLQSQARTLAFTDAKSKATDYTTFVGIRLGSVISIDDTAAVTIPP